MLKYALWVKRAACCACWLCISSCSSDNNIYLRAVTWCWHPLEIQLRRLSYCRYCIEILLQSLCTLTFLQFFLQLELIPNNQTYSGDKDLTQYFIRLIVTWWRFNHSKSHFMLSCMSKVSLPWDDVDITLHNVFSRQSSMQLDGDNTTISVKVTKKFVLFLICIIYHHRS